MLSPSVCGGHSLSLSESGNRNRDSDKKLPSWDGENLVLWADDRCCSCRARQCLALLLFPTVVPRVGFVTIQKWDFQGKSIFIKDETVVSSVSPTRSHYSGTMLPCKRKHNLRTLLATLSFSSTRMYLSLSFRKPWTVHATMDRTT